MWCLCLCSLHLHYFGSGRSIAMCAQSRWFFVNAFQPRCDLLRDTGTYRHADLVHHWNLVLSSCNNCLGHPHHLQLSRPDCVRRGWGLPQRKMEILFNSCHAEIYVRRYSTQASYFSVSMSQHVSKFHPSVHVLKKTRKDMGYSWSSVTAFSTNASKQIVTIMASCCC